MRWLTTAAAAAALALSLSFANASSIPEEAAPSAPAGTAVAQPDDDGDLDDIYDLLVEILRIMTEKGGFGHMED